MVPGYLHITIDPIDAFSFFVILVVCGFLRSRALREVFLRDL